MSIARERGCSVSHDHLVRATLEINPSVESVGCIDKFEKRHCLICKVHDGAQLSNNQAMSKAALTGHSSENYSMGTIEIEMQ